MPMRAGTDASPENQLIPVCTCARYRLGMTCNERQDQTTRSRHNTGSHTSEGTANMVPEIPAAQPASVCAMMICVIWIT
jgi:hypothetical protein